MTNRTSPPSSTVSVGPASSAPASMPAYFRGSALYNSAEHFQKKYGNVAAATVIARMPAHFRGYVTPNAPALGILGARTYPYPFVGELVRSMRHVIHAPDEDLFVRELVDAGLDVLLTTMHRVVLRYLVSPWSFLERRQEIWDLYHTAGRLNVIAKTKTSYVIQDAEWPNTDAIVCKVNLEGRRRMLEHMGLKNIDARREKCRAWGHDSCETRFRWSE